MDIPLKDGCFSSLATITIALGINMLFIRDYFGFPVLAAGVVMYFLKSTIKEEKDVF